MSAPTIDDFLNYVIAETDSHVARLVHPDSVREILAHYTAWLQRGRGGSAPAPAMTKENLSDPKQEISDGERWVKLSDYESMRQAYKKQIATLEAESAAWLAQLRELRDEMDFYANTLVQNRDAAQRLIRDWCLRLDALITGSREKGEQA